MPILGKEPSFFPENLFDDFQPEHRKWHAIYTKARQEKALARDLLGAEVPFYLPQIAKTEIRKGRRTTTWIPLFQSYVFLLGSEDDRLTALKTNRISHVLDVNDEDLLYADLAQVQRLIDCNAPLAIEKRLQPGQRVRIRAGAMQGFEGTVVERRGEFHLIVSVRFLQQGVSLKVDDFNVEPM